MDVSKAPGRVTSSPWPDHIEITRITPEEPDQYRVEGFVVEMTSQEAVQGGGGGQNPGSNHRTGSLRALDDYEIHSPGVIIKIILFIRKQSRYDSPALSCEAQQSILLSST